AVVSQQTGLAAAFPAKEPDIVEKTAQLDKASIVLINSIVTGKAIMPSFKLVQGGASGGGSSDAGIVGTWQSTEETLTFLANGQFSGIGTSGAFSGTYSFQGNVLTANYLTPAQATVQFTFSVAGNTLQISHPQVGTTTYARVGAAASATDGAASGDVVENAKNLAVVKEEGVGAKVLSEDLMNGASGTGFIVSSDGYIVTNAHVVLAEQKPEDMLVNALFNSFANQLYAEASQYYNIKPEDKDAVVEILLEKFIDYFNQYGQITDVATNYYVLNGVASPGEDLKVKSWVSVLKKEGTVFEKIGDEYSWGRDIAVIKVDKTNLPTVKLGDSNAVQVGEKVFIIGYPGTKMDELFKPESLLEPTVTQGIISARRTLKNGLETLQTDAAINHGNSGGPVFNDRGEVIGIATFGTGPEEGIEAIKFAMPINLAKEYLNELNVKNEATAIDAKYSEALEAFWKKDCYAALPKLKEVLVLYPEHPYVQDYVNACERAIQAGEIQKPFDSTIGIIIAVVLIVAAVAFYFFRRKGASLPSISLPSTASKGGGKKGRFCPSCGASLTPSEKYCGGCGKKLS
ncbi:MAG: trypsin-like peptidase domain-containing protein, partial [Candidatus Micrarchaeota archaeon]